MVAGLPGYLGGEQVLFEAINSSKMDSSAVRIAQMRIAMQVARWQSSKSIPRRLRDPNFINSHFVGHGLDIGGRPDPPDLYAELFSRVRHRGGQWIFDDGDAQFLAGVADASADFGARSHRLEHLQDPGEALHHVAEAAM